MKNFNRGGGFGDRKSSGAFGGRRDGGDRGGFGGRRDGGDRGGFGRPEMHKAVCAECGNSCEVPFKPTGERPVLCSTCFSEKNGAAPRQSSRDREFAPRDREFAPRDREFSKPNFGGNSNNNPTKEQFDALNSKLDKILHALEHLVSAKQVAVVKPAVVSEPVKVKEIKVVETKKAVKKAVKKEAASKAKTTKKAAKK